MTHIATAADGARIRYQRHGAATAPVRLLLIHSIGRTGAFWAPLVAALGDRFQVVAPDCRGHGGSDKPSGPYRMGQFADDMVAVLDHAGWEDAIVAGASMGGTVALAMAARHPGRVRGLGLIGTTAWYGPTAPGDWAGRAAKARAEGMAALVPLQQRNWFSEGFVAANPQILAETAAGFVANDVEGFANACEMLGNCDERPALPGLRLPTEIVVGSDDMATPVAMSEAMRSTIPDAALTVLDGCRHLAPLEAPKAIAAVLLRLADRTAGG